VLIKLGSFEKCAHKCEVSHSEDLRRGGAIVEGAEGAGRFSLRQGDELSSPAAPSRSILSVVEGCLAMTSRGDRACLRYPHECVRA
jgi:hypothetical protein